MPSPSSVVYLLTNVAFSSVNGSLSLNQLIWGFGKPSTTVQVKVILSPSSTLWDVADSRTFGGT